MKKIFTITLLLVLALGLMAETAKEEALKSLDNAKALIQKDDLAKAQEEINYAISKLSEIQAEALLKYIPEAPAGFTLEEKNSQALGQAGAIIGGADAIMATATYKKDDSELDLSINIGGVLGQTGGLMGLASMFGGVAGGKTVRVKGFSGTQEYDKDDKSGSLTIKVNDRITVIVGGDEIENADLMKVIAEAVDLEKLSKAF